MLNDHYILDVELLLASLEDSVGSRLHFYGKPKPTNEADARTGSPRFEYAPDSPKDSHQVRHAHTENRKKTSRVWSSACGGLVGFSALPYSSVSVHIAQHFVAL